MRWINTNTAVPLSAVKPLDGLISYRERCIEEARRALAGAPSRSRSPAAASVVASAGDVDGILYARCAETGSLCLAQQPDPAGWTQLLERMNAYRRSPQAFHQELSGSRAETVYRPKLEWIRDTLRLQGIERPRIAHVTTEPSDFTPLLRQSELFAHVASIPEGPLVSDPGAVAWPGTVEAAVLLESLDRSADPGALLARVTERLAPGGLLFVTALVASGFDIATLGLKNLYVYPPDRTNCFTLAGLERLLQRAGCSLIEVSTPGVLDVAIVRAHLQRDPGLRLSAFERQLIDAPEATHDAFQAFLQQRGLSSFARIVAQHGAPAQDH